MIFKDAVLNVFQNKTAVKLVKTLYSAAGPYTGRALSRQAGINHQACSLELRKLMTIGVVKKDGSGYGINRDNILVKNIIEPVFNAEAGLKNELSADLAGLSGADAASIILFGSVAKGTENSGSDIDTMIVVKSNDKKASMADKIEKAAGFFSGKYGNVLSPVIMSVPEFRAGYRKKNGLIMNIFRSGTVIYGKNMGELVK